jgi:predicted metal-dependent enzyme (double-stranded beta helix superfamily)
MVAKSLGVTRHPNGYWWQELSDPTSPIEVVLIIWPPGSRSLAHEHGLCWNITALLPLGKEPCLEANYHRFWGDKLLLERSQVLTVSGVHLVLPYQIHEIINNSLETVASLHCYFPRRT